MRKSKVIGLLSLLLGIAFVLDSNIGITGFVIKNLGSNIGNFLGLVFILVGIGLLMVKSSLVDKVKGGSEKGTASREYDPNIKAVRRYMEKTEHRKVSYDEAQREYFSLKGKHDDAVKKGTIKIPPKGRPLKYLRDLEDYKNTDPYFIKRAKEITRHSGTDEWIANWELGAIKLALEQKGMKVRGPESHYGGQTGPKIRHINVSGKNEEGVSLKHKHIFVTFDPSDYKLFETPKKDYSNKSKPFSSKTYVPPVKRGKAFKKSLYDPKQRKNLQD